MSKCMISKENLIEDNILQCLTTVHGHESIRAFDKLCLLVCIDLLTKLVHYL